MVGSGSVSSLTSVNVVFKLDYPISSVLDTSLINGTLQSITPAGSPTYFKPISILGVSRMGYNYTYINKEINNDGFTLYNDMENASLSLPDAQNDYGRGLCSIITWGLRFDFPYVCGCLIFNWKISVTLLSPRLLLVSSSPFNLQWLPIIYARIRQGTDLWNGREGDGVQG
ncbi:hypothetical protein L1887_22662 [Cichorium endivia]|nr:hypothetical protein L1887_22662 [Cichorium endivia]